MTTLSRLRGISLRAAVATGAGFCLIGTAWAITSANFNYSRLKTGYYTIDPMAMSPNSDEAGARNYVKGVGGLAVFDATGACFTSGVNLPHGARIKNLAVWLFSSATRGNVSAILSRNKLSTGAPSLLVDGVADFDDNVRHVANFTIPATDAKVNNVAYVYGLAICLGFADTFYGARIKYTYRNAGD